MAAAVESEEGGGGRSARMYEHEHEHHCDGLRRSASGPDGAMMDGAWTAIVLDEWGTAMAGPGRYWTALGGEGGWMRAVQLPGDLSTWGGMRASTPDRAPEAHRIINPRRDTSGDGRWFGRAGRVGRWQSQLRPSCGGFGEVGMW